MVAGKASASLAPASSALEVQADPHEVGLVMLINFIYNMLGFGCRYGPRSIFFPKVGDFRRFRIGPKISIRRGFLSISRPFLELLS